MTINSLLNLCRRNFGGRPRRFSLWNRYRYLEIRKPFWLWVDDNDPLFHLVDAADDVFGKGLVGWGYVVQGDSALWKSGEENLPADLVYYEPDSKRQNPQYLEKLADRIYALKKTKPGGKNVSRLAKHMMSNISRAQGLKIPSASSDGPRCRLTTTLINRRHLPARMLCNSLLPVVISEETPSMVLTLPEKYWPAELREWWLGDHTDINYFTGVPWHKRVAGGVLTSLTGLYFASVGVRAMVAFVRGEDPFSLAVIVMAVGPFLAAAWFLELTYRIFSGSVRHTDRSPGGPWARLLLFVLLTVLGGLALYSMWPDYAWKPTFGGLVTAGFGIRGTLLTVKKMSLKIFGKKSGGGK